jgi:hypothetical protein
MQPIPSDEKRFEIEEAEGGELSRFDVNHNIEKMLENNLLAEVTLANARKGCISVKQKSNRIDHVYGREGDDHEDQLF